MVYGGRDKWRSKHGWGEEEVMEEERWWKEIYPGTTGVFKEGLSLSRFEVDKARLILEWKVSTTL